MPDIKAEGLTFHYPGGRKLFENISFDIQTSQFHNPVVAVMGASGCGKTTFLRLLAGLESPTCGSIKIDPPGRIGYLQQQPLLFHHLSRKDNAYYYSRLRRQRDFLNQEHFQRIRDVLRLEEDLNSDFPVSNMSGGAQQRLCLLRCLSLRPSVLLLDEPCTGLDPIVRQQFLLSLREVLSYNESITFYASHHPDEALLIADLLLFIDSLPKSDSVSFTLRPLKDFLAKPSLGVARFFSSPYLNYVEVPTSVQFKFLSEAVAAQAQRAAENLDQVTLAFEPSAVQWDEKLGIPVRFVSQSSQHCLVEMTLADGLTFRVLGPTSATPPRTLLLRGDLLLFSPLGELLQKFAIKEEQLVAEALT